MSCKDYCVSFGDLFDGSGDRTKMELGPAYDDWNSGKVTLKKVFRASTALPATMIPSCCYDKEFDVKDFRYGLHVSMLSVWAVISACVFAAMWYKRNSQPLKFRSINIMTILWLNMNMGMLYAAFSGSAGLTTQCDVQLLFQQIVVPIQLFYYTVKSGQLYFLYRWHNAKREENHRLATWFYRHKWVLSDWVFYGGVIFFVTTGLMSYAISITQADLFDTDHRNGFATARATWWQIPDEYRAPTGGTPAPLCQCLQCFEDKLTGKGTSTPACTGCSVAYNTDCLTDTECVEACSPAQMLAGEFADSCTSYFETFLASGACGFPSERVDESSVVYCWAAFRPGLLAYGSLYTLLAVINLCIAASVIRMDDQLFMRFDTITCFLIECPAIILIVCALTFTEVNDIFYEASPRYPFIIILLYVIVCWSTVVSFVIPTSLAYYYDYCKTKDLAEKSNKDTTTETTVSSVHEFFKVVDDSNQAHAGRPVLFEAELIFAITNDKAGQHYVKFAWKEFTVENIKFLQAVGMLMASIDELELEELAGLARSIFHTYIEVGSPLEVNISEQLRKQAALAITGNAEPHLHKIDRDTYSSEPAPAAPALFSSKTMSMRMKNVDGVELVSQDHTKSEEKQKATPAEDGGKSLLNRSSLGGILQRLSIGGRDSISDRHPAPVRIYDDTVSTQHLSSPDELLGWFAPVVREIKQVILRDSWPRFRKSAFYSDFKELYDQHVEYETVMKDIVVEPEPRRSLSFSSAHTPSQKNSIAATDSFADRSTGGSDGRSQV